MKILNTRNSLIYLLFVLTAILMFSCNYRQHGNISGKLNGSANISAAVADSDVDAFSSFISGMPYKDKPCLSGIDSVISWRNFFAETDTLFSSAGKLRINKIKNWADRELVRDTTITTLFYPFSGPDFLNADLFYPGAKQYILIGLEPIGELPDICTMPPDSVKEYLNSVNNVLNDLLVRSYFITSRMNDNLRKNKINGVIPMLSVFVERTGHHLTSIRKVGVDSLGQCHVIDNVQYQNNIVEGVRMDFTTKFTNKIQSVFYFRADLSNKGLKKTRGFRLYIDNLPQSCTFLKSAAFLMYSHNFKIIKDQIFKISSSILQDDSGIPFRDFDRSRWNIRLYGKFSKPKNELSYYKESALAEAFRHSEARTLPFSLGYNWGTAHTCMIYAIKKY